jgi:hypothetical protein
MPDPTIDWAKRSTLEAPSGVTVDGVPGVGDDVGVSVEVGVSVAVGVAVNAGTTRVAVKVAVGTAPPPVSGLGLKGYLLTQACVRNDRMPSMAKAAP